MLIDFPNETYNVPDGTYRAEIKACLGYDENAKALVKLELDSGETFVKAYDASELGQYPWSVLFKELNTQDTDDLIGHKVEIEVKNNTSKQTGLTFSNIKKIHLIDD